MLKQLVLHITQSIALPPCTYTHVSLPILLSTPMNTNEHSL